MNHPLVHLEEATKTYPSGFTLMLERLKIEVSERVGLVGNNGAGKTSLLLLTLGLLDMDRGRVRIDGEDVAATGEWRRRTGSFLGEASLMPFLTPMEYWSFVAAAYDIRPEELANRLEAFDDFIELPSAGKKKLIREFSTGNKKKIGLTAAMMVRPNLLLLDEPFAGLDPRSQRNLRRLLAELNDRHGTTLFVSSHDLVHVLEFCGRIVVLDGGRVVQDAPVCAGSLREIASLLTGKDGSGESRSHQAPSERPTHAGSELRPTARG